MKNKLLIIALMIVILLIAFLIIPLPRKPLCSFGSGNQISVALKTNGITGQTVSDCFEIKPNILIASNNFQASTNLEAKSIIFFKGEFQALKEFDTNISNGVSYALYTGTLPLTARAIVSCGPNSTKATELLSRLDNSKYDYNLSALIAYCGDAQPCCAVVFVKP